MLDMRPFPSTIKGVSLTNFYALVEVTRREHQSSGSTGGEESKARQTGPAPQEAVNAASGGKRALRKISRSIRSRSREEG